MKAGLLLSALFWSVVGVVAYYGHPYLGVLTAFSILTAIFAIEYAPVASFATGLALASIIYAAPSRADE